MPKNCLAKSGHGKVSVGSVGHMGMLWAECVPPKSYVGALTFNVMEFGAGAFGR